MPIDTSTNPTVKKQQVFPPLPPNLVESGELAPKEKNANKKFIKMSKPFIIVVIGVCYVLLNMWLYFGGTNNLSEYMRRIVNTAIKPFSKQAISPKTTPPLTPTPTPIPLRPDIGTQGTYSVSQGTHVGPTFTQVILDPLDVKNGQTYSITVTFSKNTAPSAVVGTLTMDHSSKELTFEKKENVADSNVWQTKVLVDDTLWYIYSVKMTATNSSGSSQMEVTPR